ncbi:MAG: sulfotransferase [Pseudomonadota bacterium]
MTDKLFGNLFLSIGAMKSGTTWLYAVLQRHPEIYFTPEKEIHYFYHRYVNGRHLNEERRLAEAKRKYLARINPERSSIDRIRADLHWTANFLQSPVDDFWFRNLFSGMRRGQTYACDFSNLNAQVPGEIWPRVSKECDQLRVMYTMRDPVQRLWSHVKFQLQMTGQVEKLETWGPSDFNAFVRQQHIWVNAEYGAVLRKMAEGLGQEQRHVMFYENLHDDQRGTLADIETFLGIKAFNYPQAALDLRLTESVRHPMPDFFPGLFAEDVRRIASEVSAAGFDIPAKWAVPA